jgi:toxin CcdB
MAQFDVYLNPNSATRTLIPYLLDVQTDLLRDLGTRVVVPLVVVEEMGVAMTQLCPRFILEGREVVMSTAELAGLPSRSFGQPIASLQNQRTEIVAALDLLFTGF